MEGTFWAIVPTLIAIIMALITKEVFISLFAGALAGALLICHGDPIAAFRELFSVMATETGAEYSADLKIAGLGNAGVLIFIVELGILVALMNKSGGTAAFGKVLTRRIRSKKGALLATSGLGCMIFMDDYFDRLAVGTIMRPIADRYGISRVKLAYIIGSISISVCILVPISSWAGAITGNIDQALGEGDPFKLYLSTLMCNFYPILTIAFIFVSALIDVDPPKMELFSPPPQSESAEENTKGKAIDLVLPISALVISSILLMLFTPYSSETTLAMSGAIGIILCLFLYLPRKVMNLKEFTACIGDGFKSVGEVMIILVFAWTLTGVCKKLDVGAFIGGLTAGMGNARSLLPAILFLVSLITAFATGTAWGTFGMLVPLAVPMFDAFSVMQVLSVAAVLSGAVTGNQASPISDSTLLASSVCQCDHMKLIKAQLPNAAMIAFIAFCGFLISGVTQKIWSGWIVVGALFASYIAILKSQKRIHMPKSTSVKASRRERTH